MESLPPSPHNANPMRKIILMIGVAIVVFLAFSTYSINKSLQGSAQLTSIKDLYFPVLERLDANIVRLDKMEEHYLQAVMTGDKDMVDQANDHHKDADKVFVELAGIYTAGTGDINQLRAGFQQYKELATSVCADILEKSDKDVKERTVRMSRTLDETRKKIKDFRDSSYAKFVQTLGETQQTVKSNLYLGLALGVMNLCFMGVLVFFVRNNVKMIAVIAEQNATLELRVAERTAQLSQKTNDINAMLQNMRLGVCTVVRGNKIHPEYSDYMRSIFDKDDFAGKEILDALFLNSDLGVDTQDQVSVALSAIVGEDPMMFDFNGHLLAHEMQTAGTNGSFKTLQMDWSPILGEDGLVDKMLLIIQDVTHLRALEEASSLQKKELEAISQIIKISIGRFNDFIASARRFSAENRKLIAGANSPDADTIAALFRNMHTIKGNARTFEFNLITDAAHTAEQEYDRLRKDPGAPWDQEQLLNGLNAVDAAIERYVYVSETKLGRKGRASDLLTTRGVFVSNQEIGDLKALAGALSDPQASVDLVQLQKTIRNLGLIPLQRLVSGAVDSLSSLAKELKKPPPAVDIVDGDIAFDNQMAEALKSSFMHIVRNSLDHGIEASEERLRANKPEQGRIRFVCERQSDQVKLHVSDDGRGLALHKIYEKGLANGLIHAGDDLTPQAVAELIFHSGFSTSDQVTQVSGRGVGMDAVRTFLTEKGATVSIVLNSPSLELGFTPFEFVISVPYSQ